MRQDITRTLTRAQRVFGAFTTGQKTVAIIGTAALLLAGFVVFQWAATPSYTPLFSGLAPKDASAVVDELDTRGVPYELKDGGATVMVPHDSLYQTRIALSGEGLPSDTSDGYSILDNQDLSTSQFKEQTDFKRAMEGELARTIEGIDGVQTAVVHLAMPAKQLFTDQQDPTTASVLVATRPGSTMGPSQVQAVVHLVASSIDGLSPDQVTLADSTGAMLSAPGSGSQGSSTASATANDQQVADFQNRMRVQLQALLDRVLGAGNSTAQVTANLSFDKLVTKTTRYFDDPMTLASAEISETYTGPDAGAGGVVSPDAQIQGQADTADTAGANEYSKKSSTSDNVMNTTVEEREAAPGGVESLHVGVVLDSAAPNGVNSMEVETLVASALGIDAQRGDTVQVSAMPFDRSVEEANAEKLAAAAAEEGSAKMMSMLRTGLLVVLALGLALAAWVRSRRRGQVGELENSLTWVEQLREDTPGVPLPAGAESPAMAALRSSERAEAAALGDAAGLVGHRPEEVAAVLSGWLAGKP
ncbi:MAG: flagellar basal-body MS-ring/collar protein FliF [Candidatus Nanopelagicales bacterium]